MSAIIHVFDKEIYSFIFAIYHLMCGGLLCKRSITKQWEKFLSLYVYPFRNIMWNYVCYFRMQVGKLDISLRHNS